MSLRAVEGYKSRGSLLESHQERQLHLNLRVLVIAAVVFFGLLVGFIFVPRLLSSDSLIGRSVGGSPTLSHSQVLGICSRYPMTRDFMAENPHYHTRVTFLDSKTLEELAFASPAIYGDVAKNTGIYKVEYSANNAGILLLLDPKTKSIVKHYRVRKLTFPS